VRRTGDDQFEMSIPLPEDDHGMVGRECTSASCSPAYFKIKPGTGIADDQMTAYCPYCRTAAERNDFMTEAQQAYALKVLEKEVVQGAQRMLRDALRLGSSRRKKLGDGLLSIEVAMEPVRSQHVTRPVEEELRRDLRCSGCGLEHAVFGLAFWCPDCGADLFIHHVHEELTVTRRILDAIEGRHSTLGPRVAARDIENALEDVVSLFEAVLKLITRRVLLARPTPIADVDEVFRRQIRNTYQSVESAAATFLAHVGEVLLADLSESEQKALEAVFEKRHPITHNLGIVDRNYLRRAQSGELQGREIRVTTAEVRR
jgi:predicted  nucleic acid-binding Zn-ribbon protein